MSFVVPAYLPPVGLGATDDKLWLAIAICMFCSFLFHSIFIRRDLVCALIHIHSHIKVLGVICAWNFWWRWQFKLD